MEGIFLATKLKSLIKIIKGAEENFAISEVKV